jgi:hypothetical protein
MGVDVAVGVSVGVGVGGVQGSSGLVHLWSILTIRFYCCLAFTTDTATFLVLLCLYTVSL